MNFKSAVFVAALVCAQPASDPYYYAHWCGGALPFLDDHNCAKVFPTDTNVDSMCAATVSAPLDPRFHPEGAFADISVDWTALPAAIPAALLANVSIAVILVQRPSSSSSATPLLLRYLGTGDALDPHETWSSSKVFAMAAGAGAVERRCAVPISRAHVTGNHGVTPLGDLATIVCAYDTTMGYTSNALAKYFAELHGLANLARLVPLLGLPANHTLGGSYGENPPVDLAAVVNGDCNVGLHDDAPYVDNQLSVLAMAELLRRVVLHREALPANQFPNTTWDDMRTLLRGAAPTALFPNSTQWGGLSADPAIYVQSALDMATVEAQSNGTWRIFSKLGAGFSTSRGVGEIVTNAYACLPVQPSTASARPSEFILSARASIAGDTTLAQADATLQAAVQAVVQAIRAGAV